MVYVCMAYPLGRTYIYMSIAIICIVYKRNRRNHVLDICRNKEYMHFTRDMVVICDYNSMVRRTSRQRAKVDMDRRERVMVGILMSGPF